MTKSDFLNYSEREYTKSVLTVFDRAMIILCSHIKKQRRILSMKSTNKSFVSFLAIFFLTLVFIAQAESEKFRISDDVKYEIKGMTRQYALENAVEIDFKRVFESYEELRAYLDDIKQQFTNERNLESVTINVSYEPVLNIDDEDSVVTVVLRVQTTDSKHMLALPYPKYDSNDGFTLKLKVKDTNFFGTMEEFNFDINIEAEQEDESDSADYKIGIDFDYDFPFPLGPLDASWNNDFSLDFTIGNDAPEYDISTGFTFELPFDNFSLVFDISESVTRDLDYEEYGDELYYTTDAQFSVPIIISRIDNWGNVTYTPFVGYTVNYDKDGISEDDEDLSSPTFTVGHSASSGRVNWIGNFRTGLSLDFTNSIGYNYQTSNYIPYAGVTVEAFKAFKHFGINTRIFAFTALNKNTSIGSELRGIRDDQKYKSSTGVNKKALKVPSAFVFNLDLPIHVITTDWTGWAEKIFGEDSSVARSLRWMRYFDFEMQISPFIDAALTYNYATERLCSVKDGFYAGGLEVLVFPAKWRSIVVRASCGIDAGRKIVKKVFSDMIDDSWRKGVAAYEIYIGIGLLY